MTNNLKEGERLDDLQIKGYELIQNPKYFCFGMDAVLLSHYVKAPGDKKILDLGSGNGIIPVMLAALTKSTFIRGLEIQSHNIDMAERSIEHNGLLGRVSVVQGDIKDASKIFGASSFDIVVTNPPYMRGESGIKNDLDERTIARHEVLCSLEDIIRESSKMLNAGGRFYMVHRPLRLVDIFSLMREYKIEPKGMRLVYPYVHKEPNMVLIEGIKDGRPELRVDKPLIIYEPNGEYTKQLLEIYRSGE
ncbi:MAG: tRNA1(Val) (adenine(37)-N6)-methyltransferase [Eubacterium sp.]|nr:tRNA1(Val) (adenine(37)-N6)-methyltransferase [Eubacterium sp.]